MAPQKLQDIAFVRDGMLPEKKPPVTESGIVKWARENLFSGVLNSLLTLMGFLTLVWIVTSIYPWLRHGVWTASSVAECRAIIAETWGEGATGACWALIRERWTQFIYGFYPRELYWRPALALVLLLASLAPVLFSKRVPRQMLWLTAAYPGLAFWLLWGGSVWLPVMAMAGFAVGWAAFRATQSFGEVASLVAVVVSPLLWWLFATGPLADVLASVSPDIFPFWLEAVRSDRFGGFVLSLTIGVSGIAMSLPLGIMLALGRQSDMFLVKVLSVGFIEFIRGVPLITLLFTASLLLNYFLPPGTNFDIILRVVIMVTLFAAAYIAEVIRGGLAALPRGQFEAADALGLDYWKAQRMIILPQALKISIPGIVSTFIGMFKDTTLVVFVGLLDPLKGITDAVRASSEWKGAYWEPYIFVAAIFFIFNFSMSRYSMYLENKLKTDHR